MLDTVRLLTENSRYAGVIYPLAALMKPSKPESAPASGFFFLCIRCPFLLLGQFGAVLHVAAPCRSNPAFFFHAGRR